MGLAPSQVELKTIKFVFVAYNVHHFLPVDYWFNELELYKIQFCMFV